MMELEKDSETPYLHSQPQVKTCVLNNGSIPWSLGYGMHAGFNGNLKKSKSCCL
jgi:hypothetical protein